MSETRRSIIATTAFKDAAFDTTQTEKFCLVMQVSLDSLTLVVLDNLTNDFLAFEQYAFRKVTSESMLSEQLDKLSTEHEWLCSGFKRVDVCIVTEKFTLVPAALFDSSKISEYLNFNQPTAGDDLVLNDVLRNAEARNVYAIDSFLEKSLKSISPTIRIRHHISGLIERTLSTNKNKNTKRALAHIQNNRFDLIISEGGKLLLANCFSFQTSEDFIYYLLFACEQLKMNPEELKLEIVGEVETDSALANLTKKYIRSIEFGQRPTSSRFATEFEKFPSHFYNNLFSLHYY